MEEQQFSSENNVPQGTPPATLQVSVASNPLLIPGAIIVAGILIAGAVLYSNTGGFGIGRQPAQVVGNTETGSAALDDLTDDDPVLGDPDAPVTLVEFGDFQCPFCKRFFETTEKQIIEKYVKTGKAKLVYRDFPLTAIHSWAQKTAEAAECADEQGKFWPYHDLLYTHQDSFSMENLKAWARQLNLDAPRFNTCLDSGKYAEEIAKDFADGQKAGVNGTPATFVNGHLIAGAVPFEQFAQAIEEALRQTK